MKKIIKHAIKSNKKFWPITDKERQILNSELTKRLLDFVFLTAEAKVHVFLEELEKISLRKGDEIEFEFVLKMNTDDLLQIIGREKREIIDRKIEYKS